MNRTMKMKPNGGEIRKQRELLGLTQEELAADAGISRAHLGSLEIERRGAESHVMRRISRALGLKGNFDTLVRIDDD